MQITNAKNLDWNGSGMYLKLSHKEALILANLCANVSLPNNGTNVSLKSVITEMYTTIRDAYPANTLPPMCSRSYQLLGNAEENLNTKLDHLGNY